MNVDIETVDMMKIVDDLHLRPHGGFPCFRLPCIFVNASLTLLVVKAVGWNWIGCLMRGKIDQFLYANQNGAVVFFRLISERHKIDEIIGILYLGEQTITNYRDTPGASGPVLQAPPGLRHPQDTTRMISRSVSLSPRSPSSLWMNTYSFSSYH